MSHDEEKIDLYKSHQAEYVKPKKPVLVRIGPAAYLSIRGQGAPGGELFQTKTGALYSMAFTIKMTRKFEGLGDYAICKLEGLWWCDNNEEDLSRVPPEQWQWQLIIRTPDFIGQRDLDKAVAKLINKGKHLEVKEVALAALDEGLCVQMLHVGPYEREGETIAQMEGFAGEQGYSFHGKHHEIYLSDPRRVLPERLKTILRHPVRKR